MNYVYILKNDTGKIYVGISVNPKQRVIDHNSEKGARFTKQVGNFKVVFLESYSNLTQARRREIQIKKWRRSKKEFLIIKYQQGLPTKLPNSQRPRRDFGPAFFGK